MAGQWRHNYKREELECKFSIIISPQVHFQNSGAYIIMYTLVCIHLFLQLYQLIIGGSYPDVKASIR